MIQIFGLKKCKDSKKAERFFKERGIAFQYIDIMQKEVSRGEFKSISNAVGGYEKLIDEESKDKDGLDLLKYIGDAQREDKLWQNQQLFKTPIVRFGKLATVGYEPEVWKIWLKA